MVAVDTDRENPTRKPAATATLLNSSVIRSQTLSFEVISANTFQLLRTRSASAAGMRCVPDDTVRTNVGKSSLLDSTGDEQP